MSETYDLPDALRAKLAEIAAEERRLATLRAGLLEGWCHARGLEPADVTYDLTTGVATETLRDDD